MGASSSISVLPVNSLKSLFVKVKEESSKLNLLDIIHRSLKWPHVAQGLGHHRSWYSPSRPTGGTAVASGWLRVISDKQNVLES